MIATVPCCFSIELSRAECDFRFKLRIQILCYELVTTYHKGKAFQMATDEEWLEVILGNKKITDQKLLHKALTSLLDPFQIKNSKNIRETTKDRMKIPENGYCVQELANLFIAQCSPSFPLESLEITCYDILPLFVVAVVLETIKIQKLSFVVHGIWVLSDLNLKVILDTFSNKSCVKELAIQSKDYSLRLTGKALANSLISMKYLEKFELKTGSTSNMVPYCDELSNNFEIFSERLRKFLYTTPRMFLKQVHLSNIQLGNKGFGTILKQAYSTLEDLIVKCCQITEIPDTKLMLCKSLTNLDISLNSIHNKGFSSIIDIIGHRLLNLNVSGCHILEYKPKTRKLFKNIKSFELRSVETDPFGDQFFESLLTPSIETLTLTNFSITNISLETLTSCQNLTSLILANNKITEEGMKVIIESLFSKLKVLDLRNNLVRGFSEESKEKLCKCLYLEDLNLRGIHFFSKVDSERIIQTIFYLPRLCTIQLSLYSYRSYGYIDWLASKNFKTIVLLLGFSSVRSFGRNSQFRLFPLDIIKVIVDMIRQAAIFPL